MKYTKIHGNSKVWKAYKDFHYYFHYEAKFIDPDADYAECIKKACEKHNLPEKELRDFIGGL